jgi:hypothetical protein
MIEPIKVHTLHSANEQPSGQKQQGGGQGQYSIHVGPSTAPHRCRTKRFRSQCGAKLGQCRAKGFIGAGVDPSSASAPIWYQVQQRRQYGTTQPGTAVTPDTVQTQRGADWEPASTWEPDAAQGRCGAKPVPAPMLCGVLYKCRYGPSPAQMPMWYQG